MAFTPSQEQALHLLRSNQNVFLTGPAGTGKTYVLNHFLRDKDSKTFPVLASTGAAAILVRGRTFHSFFGLGLMEGGPSGTIARAVEDRRVRYRLKRVSGIVIDEVSMLSGEVLSTADQICREVLENNQPWGGLRVIAVGDFAQLPPVQRHQQSKDWAFLHPVWDESDFQCIYLRENCRTEDEEFLKVLADVRRGIVSDRVTDFLNGHTDAELQEYDGTCLFPLRKQMDSYNQHRLAELSEEAKVFQTEYMGNPNFIRQLKKSAPINEEIILKKHALVMLRYNDPKQRFINGSIGRVSEFFSDTLLIELERGPVIELTQFDFSFLSADGDPVAIARNFPLSLAYASTIHKSQGLTLENAFVDLGRLWECGQAYVALSRLRDSGGLHILRWSPDSIVADVDVTRFYESLQ